jgi:hypothetical protein
MTAIGRFEGRQFKPSGGKGGSEKGKPQGSWPWVYKVIGHAVIERAKGSSEAWLVDRRFKISRREFELAMLNLLPGFDSHIRALMPYRDTHWSKLLRNRVYKMYYNGTSARGKNHDPMTRATPSPEHWRNHIPLGDKLHELHELIVTGRIQEIKKIDDWT